MKKRFANNFLKNKPARDTVTGSLVGSGKLQSVSTSGGPSALSNNSLGASDASGDVIPHLEEILNDIATADGDNLKSQAMFVVRTFASKAARYTNAEFVGTEETAWKPSAEDLDLASVGVACSVSVYKDGGGDISIPDFNVEFLRFIAPSGSGVIKATKFYHVTSSSQFDDRFPALVIAIRGTLETRAVDWLVNFNQKLRKTGSILENDYQDLLPHLPRSEVKVHSGFYNGVIALLPDIKAEISKHLSSGSVRNVIFTGHSAGGAVASLVFMNALGIAAYGSLRLSLITFGCPPITSPSLTPLVHDMSSRRQKPVTALAIVNEGDPIVRADKEYVLSLIKLYNTDPKIVDGRLSTEKVAWGLPGATVYTIGDVVILKRHASGDGKYAVRGYLPTPKQLSASIFCDGGMHRMMVYAENIEKLKESVN